MIVVLFVLVSVVCGDVNSTEVKGSRMAWMKKLVDHHDWLNIFNGNNSIPQECETDLKLYINALKQGQLWASKSKWIYFLLYFFLAMLQALDKESDRLD